MTMTALPNSTLSSSEQRFVLYDVDWKFYEHLLEQLNDRHVFVTYDRGTLEIMSPSRKHEISGRLIFLLLHILTEELDIPIASCGATTFKREDLDRGLEPDECFYVENESLVRGHREIDLAVDPPPDLAVEVEISRRLLDREAIYAALGVPQLWRYDGEHLRVFLLDKSGNYKQTDRSPTFLNVPLRQIEEFLEQSRTTDETSWTRKVRAWVKKNLVQRPGE